MVLLRSCRIVRSLLGLGPRIYVRWCALYLPGSVFQQQPEPAPRLLPEQDDRKANRGGYGGFHTFNVIGGRSRRTRRSNTTHPSPPLASPQIFPPLLFTQTHVLLLPASRLPVSRLGRSVGSLDSKKWPSNVTWHPNPAGLMILSEPTGTSGALTDGR